jgi:Flp pilus assembly pilin Flp
MYYGYLQVMRERAGRTFNIIKGNCRGHTVVEYGLVLLLVVIVALLAVTYVGNANENRFSKENASITENRPVAENGSETNIVKSGEDAIRNSKGHNVRHDKL